MGETTRVNTISRIRCDLLSGISVATAKRVLSRGKRIVSNFLLHLERSSLRAAGRARTKSDSRGDLLGNHLAVRRHKDAFTDS